MTKPTHPEIGRTLKASELRPRTVVWVHKEDRPLATMWVIQVTARVVHFHAGQVGMSGMNFYAQRTGPDMEAITDDSGIPMAVYEYLGQV